MMKIQMALFGLEKSVHDMEQFVKQRGDVELHSFIYNKVEEVKELVSRVNVCDVYLFSGPLPYLYAKEEIEKNNIPAVYVPFDEFALTRALYQLKNNDFPELTRMSIDIMMEQGLVYEILHDLNIETQEIYVYSFGKGTKLDMRQIIDNHLALWQEKKIDYVLTSVGEVEKELLKENVRCKRITMPKRNMEKAIEKAIEMAKHRISKNAQIAVGFVKIKNFEQIISDKGDFFGQELILKLHQILLAFAHQTYASVLYNGNNQFVIFGTRGILDNITNNYQEFPLIQEIESQLRISIHVGFGLGLTAKQAENFAKMALKECEHMPHSTCFIVNDQGKIIGPLGGAENFSQSPLYQLLRQARLNHETSQKFVRFSVLRDFKPFSAHDLAEYFNVTKRGAELTIQKLLQNQIIEIIGEEKPYQAGRPKKLYQVTCRFDLQSGQQ